MSKYSHLSDEELYAQYKKNLPRYRKMISKLTGLLKSFFGRVFSAIAADSIIDVSGSDGGSTGESLRITGFKAPSKAKLKQYLEALDLVDALDVIDETYNRLKNSSNPALKKQAPEIKRTLDALNKAYNEALSALTDVTNKSIPDNVGKIFKEAEEALKSIDEKGAADVFVYVGAKEGRGVHFTQILDISDWERESETPILAVVVTAALEEEDDSYTMHVYVNVHDRNVLPFRYNLGKEIEGNSINAIVKELPTAISFELALHNVVAVVAPAPLAGIDATEITDLLTGIEGVSGVSVLDNAIEVEIPSDSRDVITPVLRILNTYRPIKKLLSQGYSQSFVQVDDGFYRYRLSKKV